MSQPTKNKIKNSRNNERKEHIVDAKIPSKSSPKSFLGMSNFYDTHPRNVDATPRRCVFRFEIFFATVENGLHLNHLLLFHFWKRFLAVEALLVARWRVCERERAHTLTHLLLSSLLLLLKHSVWWWKERKKERKEESTPTRIRPIITITITIQEVLIA